MAHAHRFVALSLFSLVVAACSDAGPGEEVGAGTGGAGAVPGSGGQGPSGGGGAPLGHTGGAAGDAGVGGASAGGSDTGGLGGSDGSGGGEGSSGGSGGGTEEPARGIRITDPVPGFASVAGGTTGGGTDLAAAVTVSTMSDLQAAVAGASPAIVLVEPGTYQGTLSPGANKTIIGKAPGVTIRGTLRLSGAAVSNVIVRNLAVRGEPCSSYDECRAGADAVYVGNGAHHVWTATATSPRARTT